MIPLVLTEDGSGNIAIGVRRPDFVDFLKLVANTGTTVLVPSGAKHVLFSCSTDFFASYSSTNLTSAVYAASSVQASGVAVGTAAEMNPELRTLTSVTGLSVIAPAAGNMTLAWFG